MPVEVSASNNLVFLLDTSNIAMCILPKKKKSLRSLAAHLDICASPEELALVLHFCIFINFLKSYSNELIRTK